jgi:hypothetical protein
MLSVPRTGENSPDPEQYEHLGGSDGALAYCQMATPGTWLRQMKLFRWGSDRVKGAFNSWVEALILAGCIALALVVWGVIRRHLSDDVAIPTWLIAVVLGVILAVIITQGLRLRSRGTDVQGMAALAMQLDQVQRVTAGYADHVTNMLYAFQRVREGTLGDVTVREWIEDGILDPARDLLKTRQSEDVRLSILMPNDDDLVMLFAAGHTLESKKNFELKLDESYSYWAFKKDRIFWSGDLANDPNFTRHPKATPEREYNSIISIPLHRGDHVVAIFNTIFTPKDAFDEADLIYVRLIGAVIDLIWQSTQGPGLPGPDEPDATVEA